MASGELESQRFRFYQRCVESLANMLPRDAYQAPSSEQLRGRSHWYIFYVPMENIYFEWNFHRKNKKKQNQDLYEEDCFSVGLHFERDDSDENKKLLDEFRPMRTRLEAQLEEKVGFDSDWERTSKTTKAKTKWGRLYLWRPGKDISRDLEVWAPTKTSILIEECQPVLNRILGNLL
jgi:hypothetical protein